MNITGIAKMTVIGLKMANDSQKTRWRERERTKTTHVTSVHAPDSLRTGTRHLRISFLFNSRF